MRGSSRKLLLGVLGLAVLGIVLYRSRGFFHFGDFSGSKLLHAVRGASFSYLAISIAAIFACYALRSLRWEVFQRNLGPSHFRNIFEATIAGFAAMFLLGRAAEVTRPLLLTRKEKLPLAGLFGIYALERIFDAASTAVIAAIGLLLYESHAREGTGALEAAAKTTGSLLFGAVIFAVVMLVYLRLHGTALLERRLQGWHAAHSWRARVARIVLGFARGAQTIHSWRELTLAVAYSAVHWFLVLLVYFWVSHSFGGRLAALSLSDAMLLMAFTSVGSTLQVPGVGGGSQIASILVFTKVFGVEPEPATAAAIVIWLITFAIVSLPGVPLLIHEGWSLGQLRQMARHEDEIIDREVRGAATPGESAE